MIRIDGFDHAAVTVYDIAASCEFYVRVLGGRVENFGGHRVAVHLGDQKLNLHDAATGADLVAAVPTIGALDLCLRTATPMSAVEAHLADCGVEVELGPVERAGANGPLLSVYIRDPDGNLIEVSNYEGGT